MRKMEFEGEHLATLRLWEGISYESSLEIIKIIFRSMSPLWMQKSFSLYMENSHYIFKKTLLSFTIFFHQNNLIYLIPLAGSVFEAHFCVYIAPNSKVALI